MTSNISAKLELENKRMENRLRILKQIMSAEKARREVDGGIHWESGKPGPLRLSIKNSSLPSFTTSHNVHAKANQKKPINVTFLSKNDYSAEGKLGEKPVLQCGQCEVSSAMLTCVECIKNYCQLCFAKMHHKDSLAKHRVKPILQKVKPIIAKRAGLCDTTEGKALVAVLHTTERISGQRSLLDGTYDEAFSAESFQEALTEWRSGNKVKQCNTLFEDAERNAKVSTMTGTMQAGGGSLTQQRLQNDIIFPDTNRVTYFEKILIRRHKESLLKPGENQSLSSRPLVVTQEDRVKELEEKECLVNNITISEYNIFYDGEDVVLADTDDTSFAEFDRSRHCTGVVIGDMLINVNKMESCESNTHKSKGDLGQHVQPLKKTVSSSRLKEKDKRREKHVVRKKNSNEVSVHCSKTRKLKTDPHTHDTNQLSQSDLMTAVQSAWSSCTRANTRNQLLSCFFLHAVRPANNSEENPAKPSQLLSERSASGQTGFSLGCTIWVPSNSIAQDKDLYNNADDMSHTPDQRTQESRDAYYDDSTSDSEPENERELFLSSKLGTVHESTEFSGDSRVTSSYEDLEREEMERDKADCNALENLVCELQVSSVLDGLLIALSSQGEAQELDEEEEKEGEKMEEGLLEDIEDVDMITRLTPREYLD